VVQRRATVGGEADISWWQSVGPVMPGTTVLVQRSAERVGSIISRLGDPNNGDNQINILLDPGLPNGIW